MSCCFIWLMVDHLFFGLPQSPYSCRIDLPQGNGDIVGATSMKTSQGLCFLRKGLRLSKTSARQAFQEWTLWAKQNAWEVWRQSANFCTISWLILLGLLHNTLLHWRVRICAFVRNEHVPTGNLLHGSTWIFPVHTSHPRVLLLRHQPLLNLQ